MAVLAALSAIGPAMSDMYLAAFPTMADELGVSASNLQLTLTASLIGLALGQLVLGPLSDRLGRRRPLVAGMALFSVTSVLCAFAPSIELLVAARLLQGLAGGAGVVIARAVIRDLYTGEEFIRYFAKIMLVFGLAPVLAPLIGAALLEVGGWETIFYTLAAFGIALTAASQWLLPETHPEHARSTGGVGSLLRLAREALADRNFVVYSVGNAFAFAAMFAYIGSFSFVVQDAYDHSEVTFAVLFGINALGFVFVGQLAPRLVSRIGAPRLAVRAAGTSALVASMVCVLLAAAGDDESGLVAIELGVLVTMGALGVLMPSATAMALENRGAAAGTATALMGFVQLLAGALAAPLAGIGGSRTGFPLAVILASCAVVALAAFYTGRQRVASYSRAPESHPVLSSNDKE